MPTGHIYGPFERSKVMDLLNKGVLTGEEDVAEYPAGEWVGFSQIKEISDLLMQTLAVSTVGPKIKEATKLTNTPSAGTGSFSGRGKVQTKKLKDVPPKQKTIPLGPPPDIVLSEERKLKSKTNFIPVIIVAATALMLYMGWAQKNSPKTKTLSLLVPIPSSKGDPAKSQELVKQGWSYFYKDTFLNYIKAEEYFVRAVEEAPTNTDAIVMLLMADNELWPFARQDSRDQGVVQWLLQSASRADLYGPKRSLATAISQTILNDENAKSQIDSGLISQPQEGRFYALKGQQYFAVGDYEQAKNYYEKAATLLTFWAKPFYMIGVCASHMGNGTLAEESLIKALKMNPNHMGARLELGIVEEVFFNHSEKAKENLIIAFDSDERFLPIAESRGRAVIAQIYKKNGENSKALDEAEKALALSPGDPSLQELVARYGGNAAKVETRGGDKQFMQQGEQYWRMKNFLAAQAQFKAAFTSNPRNAMAAMRAGEALWQMHQAGEALSYLQKATLADPRLVAAYTRLADYKTQRFDFDGAARVLELAIKSNPKNYEVLRAYAQFYYRRGEYVTAESYAKKSLQIYETDVVGNQVMARIQLGKKDIVKAMQYARRAVDLDPRNIEAQTTYGKIKAAFEGEKSAESYFTELINTYPSELEYRLALGEVFIQAEQFPAARQVLEQVIAFDNNNKEAYLLLGDANYLNSQWEKALAAYLSAARVDPSDPSGLFRAGEVYSKVGKYSDAQKQFQLVVRVNSFFPRAHYNLAKVLFKSGAGDLALKELDDEKRLNPRLADPYELSGDIYLTSRKFQQAAQSYQKAAEIKPQGAEIYVKQAKAYRGQGSFDAALAMLRLAAAKESGFSEIYREQGFIYEQKGLPGEAAVSFRQYLRLEPNPPDKTQILDKIKELE